MRVKEAIIVEGRCDKAKLSGLVEGTIVETGGFGIFRDGEKMALIRRLAATVGVIIFTDSDGAGFVIRRRLSQCLPPGQVKHAYIPDIFGKERRKARPSKEGKLGVEGMDPALLRDCLLRAGATVDQGGQEARAPAPTKADLWDLGLSGGPESASLRQRVQKALGLPERLSANGLLQALNALYNREEALTQLKNHIPTDRS